VTGAELVHVLVAVALTYALGFERDLRGSPAGDRVFALLGVAAGIVGVFAVEGSPNALQGVLTGIGFIGARSYSARTWAKCSSSAG
jgi:putative Mg2+ transporter-C (MgtC) family protein